MNALDAIQRNSVKQILDQHIGSANQISQKEWYELCFLTLETLQKALLSSFGKHASNSLIIIGLSDTTFLNFLCEVSFIDIKQVNVFLYFLQLKTSSVGCKNLYPFLSNASLI